MRPLLDMDTIQIEVTNACVNRCSNCTRLVGHARPFYMEEDFFRRAVDSLADFPKMVGLIGGEPLLHPRFEAFAAYLASRVPRERCGLWSCLPRGKEHLAPVVAEVFGNVLLNDHTRGDLPHCPILVSPQDYGLEPFAMWYCVDHCWIQNSWSASITPKGGFFCEVAAALDLLFDGPGGWPVEPGWWKKTPRDYLAQMDFACVQCGAPYPLRARLDREGIDDISPGMLKKLEALGSPKVRSRRYHLYTEGFLEKKPNLNTFRRDEAYFRGIAARYGLDLRLNGQGFLEPVLRREGPSGEPAGDAGGH